MLSKIKQQFEVCNYEKVVRLVDKYLDECKEETDKTRMIEYKIVSLVNLGRDDEVLRDFDQVISRSENYDLKYWRAIAYANSGKFEAALEDSRAVCSLEPSNIEYMELLIDILMVKGDDQEMIEECSKLLNIQPENTYALTYRSYGFIKLEEYQLALDDMSKCISLDHSLLDSDTANNIGFCYDKLNENNLAKKYYEMAIHQNPRHPYALNNLGYIICKEGDMKRGVSMIKRSIKYDSENSFAYKNSGKAHLLNNDENSAFKYLMLAKELEYGLDFDTEVDFLLDKHFPGNTD